MGIKQPTLGYPSKSQAVRAMRDGGMSFGDIAKKLGMVNRECRVLYRAASMSAAGIPIRTHVSIGAHVTELLKPHADKRGLTVAMLCRQIITAVASDKIIDGVLDDAEMEDAA